MTAQVVELRRRLPTDGRPWAFSIPSLVILASAAVHLAYLFVSPLDLSPDEAHYWDWSRNLDWCYYSKGPLVALLVRGGTELFGHTAFAVRVPAVLCHVLFLFAILRLVVEVLGKRFAVSAVLLAATLPPVTAGAGLTTIDGPFLAAWAWALVFARRAVMGGSGWTAAGVCVAVGVLAKPTMLLFPACVVGYLVFGRAQTRCNGWALFIFLALSLLGLLPLVLWNATHDWLSLRHVAGQAGAADGPKVGFHWWRPFEAIGGQLAALAGYWFVAWVLAVGKYPSEPNRRFLWWSSVPVVAVVLIAGLRAKAQPNWGLPAYVGGFVLIVDWLATQLNGTHGVPYKKLVAACLALGVAVSLFLSGIGHFPQVVLPVFDSLSPPPTDDDPAPIRKLDPTARLRGWRYLANAVDSVRDRVTAEEGQTPLVAGMVWTLPGELGFYCQGHPTCYSFGIALADRHSQYDVWRPNPVADAQVFRGQTFVYVGEIDTNLLAAFESVNLADRSVYRENGVPVAVWKVWVCRGFRGFPNQPTPKY